MQDTQKIRFVAANFSILQGLKSVPIGLLLILTVVWANRQQGPARDLTLPLLFGLGAILLYWLIDRYYQARYGRVERLRKQKWVEIVFGIAGGALGLGAFLLDITYDLPFSCVGLLFALSALIEYARTNLFVRGSYFFPQSLTAFVILLVASLLPLIGLDGWWRALGIRSQLFGVLIAAGVVSLGWGVAYHLSLVRLFPRERA